MSDEKLPESSFPSRRDCGMWIRITINCPRVRGWGGHCIVMGVSSVIGTLPTSAISAESTRVRPDCGQNCRQARNDLQVHNLDVGPPFSQILGHQPPVAMMRLVFTAEETGILQVTRR